MFKVGDRVVINPTAIYARKGLIQKDWIGVVTEKNDNFGFSLRVRWDDFDDATSRDFNGILCHEGEISPAPLDPHIVILGNPVDGLTFVGPFDCFDEAEDWANNQSNTWWVSALTSI